METDTVKANPVNIEKPESKENRQDLELKKACRDFEAIFINFLFKSMRKTIPESDLIEKGKGEKLYREMLDMEVSGEMSKGEGLGLAQNLYRQLKDHFDNKY